MKNIVYALCVLYGSVLCGGDASPVDSDAVVNKINQPNNVRLVRSPKKVTVDAPENGSGLSDIERRQADKTFRKTRKKTLVSPKRLSDDEKNDLSDEKDGSRVSINFKDNSQEGKSAEKVTAPRGRALLSTELVMMQKLHTALNSPGFQENVQPIMSKLYSVEDLNDLVGDIVTAKSLPTDVVARCKTLFGDQVMTMQEAQQKLASVEMTPAARTAMISFMQTARPVFDFVLPKDPALRENYNAIVKALPRDAQGNLIDLALYDLDKKGSALSVADISNSKKILGLIGGLVAANLSIILLLIFGNQNTREITSYVLIAEVALLGLMLQGGHAGGNPAMIANKS